MCGTAAPSPCSQYLTIYLYFSTISISYRHNQAATGATTIITCNLYLKNIVYYLNPKRPMRRSGLLRLSGITVKLKMIHSQTKNRVCGIYMMNPVWHSPLCMCHIKWTKTEMKKKRGEEASLHVILIIKHTITGISSFLVLLFLSRFYYYYYYDCFSRQ